MPRARNERVRRSVVANESSDRGRCVQRRGLRVCVGKEGRPFYLHLDGSVRKPGDSAAGQEADLNPLADSHKRKHRVRIDTRHVDVGEPGVQFWSR